MASITNPEEQGFSAVAKELKELNFLNVWFNWFFKLLAILSEPFMLIATIYIVIESGIPAFANPALHFLAIAVMLSAPEIILPGAFVKARDAARDGERMARVLYAICWLFVLLTSLTVINLTVWHFSGLPLNCLNCTRCLVAIGYSILMRVMLHGGKPGLQVAVPDVLAMMTGLNEQVQSLASGQVQLADIEQAIDRRLAQVQYPDIQGLLEHLSRVQNGQIEMIVQRVTEQVTVTIEQATAPRLPVVTVHPIEQEQGTKQRRIAPPKLEKIVPLEGTVGERVQWYIEQQLTTGQPMPTLQQIMDGTGCSKGTAIAQRKRYNDTAPHSAVRPAREDR